MITDADVKKLKRTFVTKGDLKKGLDRFATKEYVDKRFDRLFLYLDNRFEPLEKMKIDFDKFKDRVYISLDWLTNAFKKFEEEHTVLTEQNSRNINELGNHEKRILSLEQGTSSA
ncbi:MAG: hypothetical protein UR54_C0003G0015 [Candidatus Roizmanbacteria bacterium GW2011_GWA2_34_18]|uniref:Uncharacterized protein n=1 Tax=Candidatus Roizmanbacteria bacterium GW2011_GWA2_34_18 TaxID=1618477 RepID=A0A0G0AWD7_9BACT|nr:MAG: hypothetical protein UR54_C0003G0015 [Candidatus Roizmanbacteria bacterium GW2011_GWA2_34_18]